MVANLTVGKTGYERAWAELAGMAERGQALKDRLHAPSTRTLPRFLIA